MFPDKLKIAQVIPLNKRDDPSPFVNYRPISLLTNFSKLFERVMLKNMTYSIVANLVFGKTHSSSHASFHLINKISSALDGHEITAAGFLHLSRAFNKTDQQILFGKLEHFGAWLWTD